MTDKRKTTLPGDTPDHPQHEVGDDPGEGGEADIRPEIGINDGGPDGPTAPDSALSQS